MSKKPTKRAALSFKKPGGVKVTGLKNLRVKLDATQKKLATSDLTVRVRANPEDLKTFRGEIAEISKKLKAVVRLRMLAVEFGGQYRDKVTGFTGAVVARAEYQAGNIEILLRTLELGEVREHWYGLDRLEAVPAEG